MVRARIIPATLLALLLASPARAEDPTPPAPSPFDPFMVLVRTGDTARKQGRLDDAFIAYGSALQLREDPTVRGRVGLLAASSDPVVAANSLLRALEGNGGADEAEKNAFAKAFLGVRAKVCQLLVRGNVYDAQVRIDDSISGENLGPAYKVFLAPGKHTARGKSPTAGEATEVFECPKGETTEVSLKWTLPELPPVEPKADAAPAVVVESPDKRRLGAKHAFETEPEEDELPEREPIVGGVLTEQKKKRSRGSIGVGPTVVFGVATWQPALGVVLSGRWRPVEHVSLDLDGRSAWVASGIGGEGISAMTASGLLSACGHWRWLFGCVTGHLGIIKVDFLEGTFMPKSNLFFRPGLGGRAGVRAPLWRSLGVQFSVEALALSGGVRVAVASSTVSEVPAFMGSTSAMGVWEF